MCTSPDTLRAARPMVWIRLFALRRKPSLSASRMATSDTSGQVETLAQQVDADQHVVLPHPQLAQQLDPLQGVDLGVQVPGADPVLQQVVGEVLGHLLGQRGDQHPLAPLGAQPDLAHQVVDLALGGLDDDLGVDQPGGPDQLLDEPVRPRQLVVARGGRQVDRLADPVDELLEPQRPVVHRAGQPEAVVDQGPLAGHVALVHPADLRHGDVRLVDDQQEVLGEVVEQAVRRGARSAPVDVPGVVLDAGAGADLPHHLDVVAGPHPQPLGLQQLAAAAPARPAARSSSASMPQMARSIRSGPAT